MTILISWFIHNPLCIPWSKPKIHLASPNWAGQTWGCQLFTPFLGHIVSRCHTGLWIWQNFLLWLSKHPTMTNTHASNWPMKQAELVVQWQLFSMLLTKLRMKCSGKMSDLVSSTFQNLSKALWKRIRMTWKSRMSHLMTFLAAMYGHGNMLWKQAKASRKTLSFFEVLDEMITVLVYNLPSKVVLVWIENVFWFDSVNLGAT